MAVYFPKTPPPGASGRHYHFQTIIYPGSSKTKQTSKNPFLNTYPFFFLTISLHFQVYYFNNTCCYSLTHSGICAPTNLAGPQLTAFSDYT